MTLSIDSRKLLAVPLKFEQFVSFNSARSFQMPTDVASSTEWSAAAASYLHRDVARYDLWVQSAEMSTCDD